MSEVVEHVVPLPLPPTSGPPLSAPVPAVAAVPAPVDELDVLRAKVAEQAGVIELAKARIESLGAEKFEALEEVNRLKERLAAQEQPDTTIADLVKRVTALEALAAPPRIA